MQNDSVDKIIERYFATVTKQAFTYKDRVFNPKVLKVSPLLLRDYTCPMSCGGCCFKFTLDYLPSEGHPVEAVKRVIDFNGKRVRIYTDKQEDNEGTRCRHLQPGNGRCGIYQIRPFTCDFELIRTLQGLSNEDSPNTLTQKLFGRGWSYKRVDGGKGALCEMQPVTEKSIAAVVRKLERLKQWTDHFQLEKTWIPEIIDWIHRKGFLNGSVTYWVGVGSSPSFGL